MTVESAELPEAPKAKSVIVHLATKVPVEGITHNTGIAAALRDYADYIETCSAKFLTSYIVSMMDDDYGVHTVGDAQKLTEFLGLFEAVKLHAVIEDAMNRRFRK